MQLGLESSLSARQEKTRLLDGVKEGSCIACFLSPRGSYICYGLSIPDLLTYFKLGIPNSDLLALDKVCLRV